MDLKPWQEKMMHDLTHGRELKLTMAGRHMGKSVLTQQTIDRLMRDLNSRPIEELVLGQSTYMDTQYYTVEPIGGNWLAMETWCVDTFGDRSNVWDITSSYPDEQLAWRERGRWYANDRRFWFLNERDRTVFILRWSR
jgi:hypothetical protein